VIERETTIVNELGLHARPAAELVKTANQFEAHIEIVKDGMSVNAKSIMGVMMLAAETGSTVMFRADGSDAEAAVQALVELVHKGFGE
jgi:phosphocarrier protein HPr